MKHLKVPKADKFKCFSIRDHSKQNIESLHYYLKELSDYTDIMACENLDAAVDGFSHHVNNAYEKFCPVKIIKCKSNYQLNPSKELLKNIITKRKMYRKYKKFKMKNPNSEKCENSGMNIRNSKIKMLPGFRKGIENKILLMI